MEALRVFALRCSAALPTLILALASCSQAPDGQPTPVAEQPITVETMPEANAPNLKLDACTLLTREEVERIVGVSPQQTTASERSAGNTTTSLCYIALPAATDSLSLAVKQPLDGNAAQTPIALWEEMFHREKPKRIGRDGKEKQQPSPTRLEGIGDEAFWSGGRFGGTLHVLKGPISFTLSIGGPGDEAVMLQRLKELGTIIASRL